MSFAGKLLRKDSKVHSGTKGATHKIYHWDDFDDGGGRGECPSKDDG